MKYFNLQIVNPDRVPAGHVPTSLTPEQRAKAEAAKAGKTAQTSDTAAATAKRDVSKYPDLTNANLATLSTVRGSSEPHKEVYEGLGKIKDLLGGRPMTYANVKDVLEKKLHLKSEQAEKYAGEIFEQISEIKKNPEGTHKTEIDVLEKTLNAIDTEQIRENPKLVFVYDSKMSEEKIKKMTPEEKEAASKGIDMNALGYQIPEKGPVDEAILHNAGAKKDHLKNTIEATDTYLKETGRSDLSYYKTDNDKTDISALARPLSKAVLGSEDAWKDLKAKNPKMTNRELLQTLLTKAKEIYHETSRQYEVLNTRLFFEGSDPNRFKTINHAPGVGDVSQDQLSKAIKDYNGVMHAVKVRIENGEKIPEAELRNLEQNGKYLQEAAQSRLSKAIWFTATEQADLKKINGALEELNWQLSGTAGKAVVHFEEKIQREARLLQGQAGLTEPKYTEASEVLLRAYPDLLDRVKTQGEEGKKLLAEIIKDLAEGRGIRKVAHFGFLIGEYAADSGGKLRWSTTDGEVKVLKKFIELARKNLGENDSELRELEKYDLTNEKLLELYRKDNSLGGLFDRYKGGQLEGDIRISMEDLKVAGVENYQYSAAAAVLSGTSPELRATDKDIPVKFSDGVVAKLPADLKPVNGKWTFIQFQKFNKQMQVMHALPKSERPVALKPDQPVRDQLQVINLMADDLNHIEKDPSFDLTKLDVEMPVIKESDLNQPIPEGASPKFRLMVSFYKELADVRIEDRRYSPPWRSALVIKDGVVVGIDASVLARSGKINANLHKMLTNAGQATYDSSNGMQQVIPNEMALPLYYCMAKTDQNIVNYEKAEMMFGARNEKIEKWAKENTKYSYERPKGYGDQVFKLTVRGNMTEAEYKTLMTLARTESEKTHLTHLYEQSAINHSEEAGLTFVLHARCHEDINDKRPEYSAKKVYMREDPKPTDGKETPAATGETAGVPDPNAPPQAPAKPAAAQKKSKTKSTAPAAPAKPPKQPAAPATPPAQPQQKTNENQNMATQPAKPAAVEKPENVKAQEKATQDRAALGARLRTEPAKVLSEFKNETNPAKRQMYFDVLCKRKDYCEALSKGQYGATNRERAVAAGNLKRIHKQASA